MTVLVACGDDDDDTGDTTAEETTTTAAADGEEEAATGDGATDEEATGGAVTQVAVAYDTGGRGDGGFNDLAYLGASETADALGAELTEVTARLEDTDADRVDRLTLLAEDGNNPIIAVGFIYATALAEVAPEFPDTWFGIVDDATVEAPNVTGLTFAEHEGSFLVGAAAALMTETDSVGFIGGVDTPLIQRFQAGFDAGAQAVNPDIELQANYLTQPPDFAGFNDPQRGGEAARGMYEAGADIIFSAAGGSGSGVFDVASELGTWAIGVDADEYNTADEAVRDVIITSMLKKVDVAVTDFIENVDDGSVEAGVSLYDLSNDGVGYSTSGGYIDDITGELDDFAEQIRSGEITVPDAL
ncbi:MAG: BMP family ABC transporter substrate-binding protein [Actinomycetota bacterium]|nr:BMP family ABC transporter substrate-binding protein [Actinomycetota bacterium]